jgi:hypothetical protein
MQGGDLIEKIRKRAYRIWETMGRPEGRDLEHWLQAEKECRTNGVERKPVAPSSKIAKPQSKGAKKPLLKQTAKPPRG